MCEPSNTSTMKNDRRLYILLLLFLLLGDIVWAQKSDSEVVKPLRMSQRHPILFDLYIYGSGSYKSHNNLWTATNNLNTSKGNNNKKVYETLANLGIEIEAHKGSILWLGASMGYKYGRYAYNSGFSFNEGVQSHWFNTSISANCHLLGLNFGIGVVSDIFLGSRIKNNDYFSYEGLNSKCFNHASLGLYFGASVKLNRLKIEGRFGNYFKPQLNPNKIAYYNQHNTHVEGLYWEVKASYRIFTSGKQYSNTLSLE